MITADTVVGRVLDEHPELVDVLAEFHPHFARLRNRLLRRVMAPRVTVGQAARIAGVEPDALLRALRRAAGEPDPAAGERDPEAGAGAAAAAGAEAEADAPGAGCREVAGAEGQCGCRIAASGVAPAPALPKPPALEALPAGRQVHLDVRDDIRRGAEPFALIMSTVKALAPDAALVLRTPFEPIPLYDVLGKRGLAHWTEFRAPDDWVVWFHRECGAGPAPGAARAAADAVVGLDVRGLEPPEPMVRVLRAVEALAPGQTLLVVHERRPLFLYPQLDERGLLHETVEIDGRVEIRVRRPGGPGARAADGGPGAGAR